ncbi:zinc finger protein 62 isoform X2 [Bombyx mori]|uniref:zinc finger protein 62 isoform X2 n=1 Tax=Bombyx mori TaxID=7091 RepID=UPI002ED20FE1
MDFKDLTYCLTDDEVLVPKANVCFCCLTDGKTLIEFRLCKHRIFLENHFKEKLNIQNLFVCVKCHSFMKKINLFLEQVEQSYSMLMVKTPYNNVNMTMNLVRSKIEVISTLNDVNEIKIEPLTARIENESKIEIKLEDAHNISKADISTATLQSLNEPLQADHPEEIKVCEGIEDCFGAKLKTTYLSRTELEAERELAKTQSKYTAKLHKCEKCVVSYDNDLHLRNHLLLRHNEKNRYKCEICDCTYDTELKLETHTRRHYLSRTAWPRGSAVRTAKRWTRRPFAQHRLQATGTHVRRRDYSLASLRYHASKHKEEFCELCKKTYPYGRLWNHMNLVHGNVAKIKCDLCDKSYKQRSALAMHRLSAHSGDGGQESYCVDCGKFFCNKYSLAVHLREHSEHVGKRYECDDCGLKYYTRRSIVRHITSAHLGGATEHKCPRCDKIFATAHHKRRHMRLKHESKKMPRDKICEICASSFTSSKMLKAHIRTHTGERPYVCPVCEATFAHSGTLYNHKRLMHGRALEK